MENNSLSLVARGCAIAAPCRTKVAEQLLEIGVKAGLTGAVAKMLADKLTADELDHLVTLEMMGNDEITGNYLSSLQDKYGSGSSSAPNIGKDLTDAEKAELGGSGSGTGTPPPPENDPKQQNEKPVDKLNQKQESAIKKIDNTIKNALKDHDITGTLKDMDGNDEVTGKYLNSLQDKYAPAHTGSDQVAESGPGNTGGNQLPAQGPNHTGNNEQVDTGRSHTGNTDGVPNTGGSTTVTPIPDGPNSDDLTYLSEDNKYVPSPKHAAGGWGTPMDLSDSKA